MKIKLVKALKESKNVSSKEIQNDENGYESEITFINSETNLEVVQTLEIEPTEVGVQGEVLNNLKKCFPERDLEIEQDGEKTIKVYDINFWVTSMTDRFSGRKRSLFSHFLSRFLVLPLLPLSFLFLKVDWLS